MAHDQIIIKKKKVVAHSAHHGGSWKVAYADFVTAMMAFFMVMWIMGLSDDNKAQIQGYFNDPMGFNKNPPKSQAVIMLKAAAPPRTRSNMSGTVGASKADAAGQVERLNRQKEGGKLAEKIEKSLAGTIDLKKLLKNIEFTITKEGIRIEFVESTGSVFFVSGSHVIRPEAAKMIRKLAPLLKATGRPMIVEGHTDAKAFAGALYNNWELSTMRALSLRQQLAQAGLGADRFLAVRGLADQELKNPGNPYDFRNRRVTLLLPWTKVRPTVIGETPKEAMKAGVQATFKAPSAMPDEVKIAPKH